MNQTDSFKISVTAFKEAFTCKLLQLLPDRCMVLLIVELVGNRSFTVTPANVETPKERQPTGICPGTPSFKHLHLWPANYRLQKVGYACTNDLAIMHADGDWQTVEEVQSKGMATVGEHFETWKLNLSTVLQKQCWLSSPQQLGRYIWASWKSTTATKPCPSSPSPDTSEQC